MTEPAEPDWWTTPPRTNPNAGMGRTQRRVLAYLAQHHRQAFKMGDIAKALNIRPSEANERARSLVARGLAQIATPVGIGRTRHVQVTPAGKAKHRAQPPTAPLQ